MPAKIHKINIYMYKTFLAVAILLSLAILVPAISYAVQPTNDAPSPERTQKAQGETYTLGPQRLCGDNDTYCCGDPGPNNDKAIVTAINFGCVGKGAAMLDLTFAIIRFLSNGVGLVIIGSLIYAGIQYSGSRGDPQSTAMAVNRIQSTVFALLLFIFAYAIINYLVPGVFLR